MLLEGTSNVVLAPIPHSKLDDFKRLNSVIFPVKYLESFYAQCMQYEDMTHGAFLEENLIGAIAVRLESVPGTNDARLYIMSLGVLAPYRSKGIGSALLKRTLHIAQQDENIVESYLHVHTSNEDAIAFYKRFGFQEGAVLQNYYKRLNPPDAVILHMPMRTAVCCS